MQAVRIIPLLCALAAPPSAPPEQKDIPTVARDARRVVVSIVMSDDEGKPVSQGSGFFISGEGQVATNYHVIESGASAVVKLPDGAFFVVKGMLASDEGHDIAVVKAQGTGFEAAILGDSDQLQVGEQVVAIGSPLSLEATVSSGILSAVRTDEQGRQFLQVTAPISPGSSGGPLFNMAGEVVGVTTFHFRGGENLNFAVPINDLKRLLVNNRVSAYSKLRALPNVKETPAVPSRAYPDDSPQAFAQKAGEQWLALVDAGKYGESWDDAAPSFKTALSRDEWIRKATTSRRTLGKLVSRKLTKSNVVKDPPSSPPGVYAGLQYHSAFLRLNSAGETVVLVLDKDGKWRVSDYIVNKTG